MQERKTKKRFRVEKNQRRLGAGEWLRQRVFEGEDGDKEGMSKIQSESATEIYYIILVRLWNVLKCVIYIIRLDSVVRWK